MNKFQINTDEFKPIKLIGVGIRNQVYLVHNLTSRKNFIAKIKIAKYTTEQEHQMFFNEVEMLSKVENPAILSFLGYSLKNFDQEDHPTIFTEYIPNCSLSHILHLDCQSRAPISWTNTKKCIILLGTALGMQYLHSLNIIHSELRPTNILLDRKLYPHISNFWYGKSKSEVLSKIRTEIGFDELCYIAPEILRCQNYDSKIDIYSYSLIFYEIITGKHPYSCSQSPVTIQSIIDGERPDISIIPNNDVKFFLQKCWSNDPSERPTFKNIISFLTNKTFTNSYEINVEEVKSYLKLFERKHIQLKNQTDHSQFQQSPKSNTPVYRFIENNNRRVGINIFLCGISDDGKTCIFNRFIHGIFPEKVTVTIGIDYGSKVIQTGSGAVNILLRDTPGYERVLLLLPMFTKNAHAIILTVSAYEENWRSNMSKVINCIKETNKNSKFYIAITKCDLEMTIPMNELIEFANENNCLIFLTSSKTDPDSVNSMFLKIANDIIDDDIIDVDIIDDDDNNNDYYEHRFTDDNTECLCSIC